MKKIFITCATILALLSSCSSILDKEDLSSISEEQVWEDETLTTAFLNALYISIPSWDPALADASDEATGGGGWTNGTTTPDNMSKAGDNKPSWDSAPTWYCPTKISVIATLLYRMHKIRTFVQSTGSWRIV